MTKGAQTHDRILACAVSMASRDGLDGVSLGALASELGLSKSGLFAHFRSKEELQVQVLQAGIWKFEQAVLRPALKATRGEPRLRALFDLWLAWGCSRELAGGCLLITASVELDDRPGAPRDLLQGAIRQWYETLSKAARLAQEQGHFRADLDPEQFAFELYGVVLGFHQAHRLLKDPRAESFARAAFERLLFSCRSR